ncbi:MAG: hypothetical protein J7604_18280 [Sporocytophaga sp.]|uniref:hypothetical protein n=1 Tax=Sporocytophaga sp. TaxID=2231183 RepID=UPI001B0932D3|nr:hypothetical protein [Sporocytophaga sp.]MBO9702163.1 hypothetical protein [Sporocytophaga sp.]
MSKNIITIKPSNSISSGHELIIISRNPNYNPTNNQIESTLEVLAQEYPNCEITLEIYDLIEFIDQGQNFKSVLCNKCQKELSIEFWQDKMSESYDHSHFENMAFRTECCNLVTNLNDLIYEGDCGFGSFRIAINNAEPDVNKEEPLARLLLNTLGTDVKLFWKHI